MAIKNGAVSMLEAVRCEDLPIERVALRFGLKSTRLALVPAAPHRHTHTHPVFTERRVDGLPILTGHRCVCGHVQETGFIQAG
jgi:hypothetical protein